MATSSAIATWQKGMKEVCLAIKMGFEFIIAHQALVAHKESYQNIVRRPVRKKIILCMKI
jgi:hypothetical protein